MSGAMLTSAACFTDHFRMAALPGATACGWTAKFSMASAGTSTGAGAGGRAAGSALAGAVGSDLGGAIGSDLASAIGSDLGGGLAAGVEISLWWVRTFVQ